MVITRYIISAHNIFAARCNIYIPTAVIFGLRAYFYRILMRYTIFTCIHNILHNQISYTGTKHLDTFIIPRDNIIPQNIVRCIIHLNAYVIYICAALNKISFQAEPDCSIVKTNTTIPVLAYHIIHNITFISPWWINPQRTIIRNPIICHDNIVGTICLRIYIISLYNIIFFIKSFPQIIGIIRYYVC